MPIATTRGPLCFATASVLCLLTLPAAWASSEAPVQSADATTLDEVVVTAQKRSENLQDIPKQVAVVSQTELTDAGVTRISDLQTVFPTVTATSQSQNSKVPGIRGIQPISAAVGVQSQAGIVVDDIPQATFSTLAFELTDVERVEVLAGPQSTLSGRNAAAGLINLVTRSPLKTAEYDINAEQTTDHQTRATVFATGPVSSTLAYSASLVYNKWDGPLQNGLKDDEGVGGYDTKGARVKLLWKPTDDLSAMLTGYYFATNRLTPPILSGPALIRGNPNSFLVFDALRRPLASYLPGLNINPSNHTVYSVEDGWAKTRDSGGSLRVDRDFEGLGTLSSLSSYTYSTQPAHDILLGAPRDHLVLPVSDFGASRDVRSKFVTQEIRLTSPSTERFTYLVGAIYTHTNLIQPYYRPDLFPINFDRSWHLDSSAVFGRGTFEFTQADSITAGLRYQYDSQGYVWFFHPISRSDSNATSQGSNGYGFMAGELSYKHQFKDSVNAYATYSRSETGKAYDTENNALASTGATLPALNSEVVNNIEVGLKSQFLDRRLTFNVDAFYAKYKNYQIQTSISANVNQPSILRLDAIGKVDSKGGDLSVTFRVTPDLRVGLNGAYTASTIISFPGATCYTLQTAAQGCVNGTQGDLNGLQLPYAPKIKLTGSFDYSHPITTFNLDVGGFYRYQTGEHFDVLGDPSTYIGGYGVFNIFGGFSGTNNAWSVRAYVNNVFNKHFYASVRNLSPIYTATTITADYDRQSFRYGGIRVSFKFP